MGRCTNDQCVDLHNPPDGMMQDFYEKTLSLDALARKYHIDRTRLVNHALGWEWPTLRRIGFKQPTTEKAFKHVWISSAAGKLPPQPQPFGQYAVRMLTSFPRKWRERDLGSPKIADSYDPDVHCALPITESGKMR